MFTRNIVKMGLAIPSTVILRRDRRAPLKYFLKCKYYPAPKKFPIDY
jgi:hypothetical protein